MAHGSGSDATGIEAGFGIVSEAVSGRGTGK
jgi:hypothetical protein